MRFLFISMQFNKPSNARFIDRRSIEIDLKYLQKALKTNDTYLPLKRISAGPFFKSTLVGIGILSTFNKVFKWY